MKYRIQIVRKTGDTELTFESDLMPPGEGQTYDLSFSEDKGNMVVTKMIVGRVLSVTVKHVIGIAHQSSEVIVRVSPIQELICCSPNNSAFTITGYQRD